MYATDEEQCNLQGLFGPGQELGEVVVDAGYAEIRLALEGATEIVHAVAIPIEELYDRKADPHEYTNLAGDAKLASVKREMARWLPGASAAPKPDRDDWDFDFASYQFKRRAAK